MVAEALIQFGGSVNTLADNQASLSRSIALAEHVSENDKYVAGQLVNLQNRVLSGPYRTIPDL
jgi:hypothetical protein